jgi:hypothetical protein
MSSTAAQRDPVDVPANRLAGLSSAMGAYLGDPAASAVMGRASLVGTLSVRRRGRRPRRPQASDVPFGMTRSSRSKIDDRR